MNVQSTYNARTYREVRITHNFDDRPVSDDLLVGYAMHAINETPESVFGWDVSRPVQHPNLAVVTLHID